MGYELDKDGVKHEMQFWKGFVKTPRFKAWCENKPTPEVHYSVANFINDLAKDRVINVLDCGSGPVSILHGLNPNLKITSCDPLGDDYARIVDFAELGLAQPVARASEDLPEDWHGRFDVVHMSNALDHTKEPLLALNQLMACVKNGGHLIIEGFKDEAIHEGRAGFHQHDLGLVKKGNLAMLYVKTGNNVVEVHPKELGSKLVLSCQEQRSLDNVRTWWIWGLQKLA